MYVVNKHPEAFTGEGGVGAVAPATHNICQHTEALIAAAIACKQKGSALARVVQEAIKATGVPGSEAGLNW